jgi:hypothetical protein
MPGRRRRAGRRSRSSPRRGRGSARKTRAQPPALAITCQAPRGRQSAEHLSPKRMCMRSRARRRRAEVLADASPSAIALSWIHGSKRKPSECMSLSSARRIAEQVPRPPSSRARASRSVVGHSIFKCAANEMPGDSGADDQDVDRVLVLS